MNILTKLTRWVKPKFAHPFKDGWHPNRLDMGADGTFKDYIYAPFKGRVIYAGPFNGWNGSYGIVIEARRSGSRFIRSGVPTARLYFTEGCYPLLRSGDHFRVGQRIARAVDSPYGDSYGFGAKGAIEWGVAARGEQGVQPNTQAVVLGVGSSAARQMVLNFSKWFQKELGVAAPTSSDNAGNA